MSILAILAFEAARNAINNANINAEEIDLIIVATTTPDKIFQAQLVMFKQS